MNSCLNSFTYLITKYSVLCRTLRSCRWTRRRKLASTAMTPRRNKTEVFEVNLLVLLLSFLRSLNKHSSLFTWCQYWPCTRKTMASEPGPWGAWSRCIHKCTNRPEFGSDWHWTQCLRNLFPHDALTMNTHHGIKIVSKHHLQGYMVPSSVNGPSLIKLICCWTQSALGKVLPAESLYIFMVASLLSFFFVAK